MASTQQHSTGQEHERKPEPEHEPEHEHEQEQEQKQEQEQEQEPYARLVARAPRTTSSKPAALCRDATTPSCKPHPRRFLLSLSSSASSSLPQTVGAFFSTQQPLAARNRNPHLTSPHLAGAIFAPRTSSSPASKGAYPMHQYIPPPPPQPSGTPAAHMALPPPPPRPTGYGNLSGMPIPPPPHANNWGPPRPPYQQTGYDPGQYRNYPHNLPPPPGPPPPQQMQHEREPPLTSATYIPGGESFGPGVGIPPLHTSRAYPEPYYRDDSYSANTDTPAHAFSSSLLESVQSVQYGSNNGGFNVPQTPSNRGHLNIPTDRAHAYDSPGPPTATLQTPMVQSHGSVYHRPDSNGTTPISPHDPAMQWPAERVQHWLASNNFSRDWQETFRTLGLEGSKFLDIGRGHGSKGNVAMMHQVIFPQLAKQCTASGTGWDQNRERDEGRKLRRLVRSIVETGATSNPRAPPQRSDTGMTSAGTEGTVENSPYIGSRGMDFGSTPTTAGNGEESPGRQILLHSPVGGTIPPRRISTQHRNFTAPGLGTTPDFSEGPARSPYSREVLQGLDPKSVRHSPNTSTEFAPSSLGTATNYRQASPQQSPGLSSARLATNGGQLSAGLTTGGSRYYSPHNRVNSTESINSTFANTGSGPPSGRSFDGRSESRNENKRNGYEGSRPGTGLSRYDGIEVPTSAKDHDKGFFKKIMGGRKKDSHPSPDDTSLDSPTSPASHRTHPSGSLFGKSGMNSSETSLNDRPPSRRSAQTDSENKATGRSRNPTKEDRRFAFVTPDGWNYRLVDITNVDSAMSLRTVCCEELSQGLSRIPGVELHLTLPGQYEHNRPLSDSKLLKARSQYGNRVGELKIFVKIPQEGTNVQPSAGLGVSLPIVSARAMDEDAYSRLNADTQLDSPGGKSGESTLVADKSAALRKIAEKNELTPRSATDGTCSSSRHPEPSLEPRDDVAEEERRKLLEAAAEEHRKETKRKQDEYLRTRFGKLTAHSPDPNSATSDTISYRSQRIIDFDEPRASPYEDLNKSFDERKNKQLVPLREPPPVPADTSTLLKANSLSRSKSRGSWPESDDGDAKHEPTDSHPEKRKAIPQSASGLGGIAAAIVGAGNLGAGIGAANRAPPKAPQPPPKDGDSPDSLRPSQQVLQDNHFAARSASGRNSPGGSPRSPGELTMSKGNIPFRIPDYEEAFGDHPTHERPDLTPVLPDPPLSQERSQSPHSAQPQESTLSREPSRVSIYGPTHDFEEARVSFITKSPNLEPMDSDDDDSDDGLFAAPLAGRTGPPPPAKNIPLARNTSRAQRPNLTLKTQRSKNSLAQVTDQPTEHSAAGDRESQTNDMHPESAASATWTDSPDDSNKFSRRESFASDIWANRPPAEALVEHLDELFPHVNLDQPMLEEDDGDTSTEPGLDSKPMSAEPAPINQSLTRGGAGLQSIAQRNMRKSGVGLGRTKSIREVVKSQYQPLDKRSIAGQVPAGAGPSRVATLRNGGDIIRRKSTKMFNARTEQVRPQRGSRLVMETIPQDHLPNVPSRQPTFKWMKGQLIGKGTFGRVYLGMNITTGELIAVKQVEVNAKAAGSDKDKIKELGQGYSAKVDIWSLGCVVLEMFAGKRPWSKEEAIGAIYKLGSLNQAPPIPEDVSRVIGVEGLSFMYDCFTIDPMERPTAETLLRAPFCFSDPNYNFLDTELYAKIRGAFQ
ncbi:STE STE11 BCK1 kinase [Pyrenophora seminiperda CCB06]|uniref:mitogen-activated protein kinase n=1 Tax=Pyrenophora seminiperda CCB06 TaxID=1302712 RepID=A0A3M7M7P6_9PLEO|nr:STE STE11 BCK1 kinase [Pyrenophora seminiperda CCB06]